MESSAFYTMKGYELAADAQITTAMEDYLEMICRLEEEEAGPVRIRALSQKLHVKPSSAGKRAGYRPKIWRNSSDRQRPDFWPVSAVPA